MLSQLLRRSPTPSPDLLISKLYDETTFYKVFLKDLGKCQSEAIIESPFVTNRRLADLLPILKKLKMQYVRIAVITKDPREHDKEYVRDDAIAALASLQTLGVQVIYTDGHHRKVAILDRKVLYEGSLNILSQNNSREVMRKIESVQLAWQMARFVGVDRFL
jgi:phosphatidylserine/phosphatidylglycerophosphate/cardiolipin synthase-like enzyme